MDYTTRATLLTRLSEGLDPTAWSEFHRRYGELIRGFAIRQGLQQADCDDVLQEVLMILTKSMDRFKYDPTVGKFRSYLKTLAIRAVFRKLRQERRRSWLCDYELEAEQRTADSADSEIWEDEWRRHHVRLAMTRLKSEFNDRDRMAFSLYAMQGKSAAQTAEALEMSIDQIYQAKSRILKRLSKLIAEQIEDEG